MSQNKQCPYCGEEIDSNAVVCPICGEQLEAEENAVEKKVCPFCGEEIDSNADVCPYCGEQLGDTQIQESEDVAEVPIDNEEASEPTINSETQQVAVENEMVASEANSSEWFNDADEINAAITLIRSFPRS
ncbi:MAG: zinc ribbon domain-containing protein [Salinivirgaceae bacterium]|nr:zinc ribbon domain-containing protein [Salinivirgaceae bacterium]